jgi:hypothetical protein
MKVYLKTIHNPFLKAIANEYLSRWYDNRRQLFIATAPKVIVDCKRLPCYKVNYGVKDKTIVEFKPQMNHQEVLATYFKQY